MRKARDFSDGRRPPAHRAVIWWSLAMLPLWLLVAYLVFG